MSRSFTRRLDRAEAAWPETSADPLRIVRVIIGNDGEPQEAHERCRAPDGASVLRRMTPDEFAAFKADRAA